MIIIDLFFNLITFVKTYSDYSFSYDVRECMEVMFC